MKSFFIIIHIAIVIILGLNRQYQHLKGFSGTNQTRYMLISQSTRTSEADSSEMVLCLKHLVKYWHYV